MKKEIQTKIFRMDNNPNMLGFTNFKRIDEEILFEHILKRLKENPEVRIGSKQIGPSEDYYDCTIAGLRFTLYYDIDYGVSVHSVYQEALQKLVEYFNGG